MRITGTFVVLSPIAINETFCLQSKAWLIICPNVGIERATMEAPEQVSQFESVSCKELIRLTLNIHLAMSELVIFLGTLSFDVQINNTLVYVKCRIVKLSDIFLQIFGWVISGVPALTDIPINCDHSSL